jgi:glutamine amidotransferase
MIAIVNYDMGNLGSIKNMIKKIGGESIITNDKAILEKADGLILPGVGSFDAGMINLKKYDLVDFLKNQALEKKKPMLGICLGMQLMTNYSEEGVEKGLGIIDATTIKFLDHEKMKVPHMGWNFVDKQKNSLLLKDFAEPPRFYFVHSFYVKCNRNEDVLGVTTYGSEFDSAFEHENVFGVQYHPEKSHRFGMTLLKGFLKVVENNA